MPRRTKTHKTPSPRRQPKATESPDEARALPLAWRFCRVDHGGEWPWIEAGDRHADIVHRMQAWESMTVNEFFQARSGKKRGGAKGVKFIPLKDLVSKARSRAKTHLGQDVDGLWELNVDGGGRIWGQRDGSTFKVVWWDPEHTVCSRRR